ncbi:MAG TPA: L,D-transpeptidase [Desulfuromonadales bacterium]|nr:L,D-transpeptidase [Desulfuromonadales bacterium]
MKYFRYLQTGLVLAAISVLFACSEPPVPSEFHASILQDRELWRAGAPLYAPKEYGDYLDALRSSQELLTRQKSRFVWFRNYDPATQTFRQVLAKGEAVLARVQDNKAQQQSEIDGKAEDLDKRIKRLRGLSESVKDNRLAARRLMKAEVLLDEATALAKTGKHGEARARLEQAIAEVEWVFKAITPLVKRYADREQIAYWRRMLNEGVAQSKKNGGYLIVVSKIDRELTLYRNGIPQRTYQAGLGFNFLSDKLYSGDRATPEGNYRIIKKLPASKYFRALLIDYPNAEDQRRFARAKREGLLSASARIGGLIEIHGGGKDGMTYGCVALEDQQMLDLYNTVEVGTPVVIVGAVEFDNVVSSFLKHTE